MEKALNAEEYIRRQKAALATNPECGNTHYNIAVALMSQRRFEEAERELIEAIGCSPNLAEAYVQLGGICLNRGDLQGCLEYNKKAVKCRAGFAEGYANIGFVYLNMGNAEEAIPPLLKAIRWNSRFIQAYATLANAYMMTGQITESILTNRKALDLEPDFAVAHNNLAIAYLEDGQYDLAVEHCDKAVKLGYPVAPEILKEIEKHR